MADRPIIFSGPMVRALIDGRKTQTRRVLKLAGVMPDYIGPSGCEDDPTCWGWEADSGGYITVEGDDKDHLPGWRNGWRDWLGAYEVGDRLWVRETWTDEGQSEGECLYRATVEDDTGYYLEEIAGIRWRSSIHMPRWASRLTLTVTDVRVQRVRDISEADAVAEGARQQHRIGDGPDHAPWTMTGEGWRHDTPREAFQYLWDDLNAKRGYGWDHNPWVVALTFTVERRNIDAAPSQEGGL